MGFNFLKKRRGYNPQKGHGFIIPDVVASLSSPLIFTRNSVAYDHNFEEVAANFPRIHPDRGVMVERGTTNNIISSITPYNGASLSDESDPLMGNVKKIITAAGKYSGAYFNGTPVQGVKNSASVWIKGTEGKTIQLTYYDEQYTDKTSTDTLTGEWQRVDQMFTGGTNARLYITNGEAAGVQTFYLAYYQMERWNWPSSWQNPSSGARVDEYLQLPIDYVNLMEGTIEAKVYINDPLKNIWPYSDTSNESYIWSIGDIPFDNVLALKYQGQVDPQWQVEISGQGTFEGVQVYRPHIEQDPATGTIQTITVRYNGDQTDVILNGDVDNKASSVGFPVIDYPEATMFNIGCWYPNCYEGSLCGRYDSQTWIHSICISDSFRTDSDIISRAINPAGFPDDENVLFNKDFTEGI